MNDAAQRPIIIVIKKKDHGHGHHGGAWKVAFADFVTAMMALFLVLWLVAQSPKTKSSVGAYFRDPMGVDGGGNLEVNAGPNAGGAGFFEGGNTAVALDTSFKNDSGVDSRPLKGREDLATARSRLAQALLALRRDSWSHNIELTAVETGLRIEIQDTQDEALFASGGTKINPAARSTLATIAGELAKMPNHLAIEGHTDATVARTKLGNWDLSAARANAARRFLIARGLRRDQVLEVRAMADRNLRFPHAPEDPRNRRIAILVLWGASDERPPAEVEDQAVSTTDSVLPPKPTPTTKHPLLQRLRGVETQAQGPDEASPGVSPATEESTPAEVPN